MKPNFFLFLTLLLLINFLTNAQIIFSSRDLFYKNQIIRKEHRLANNVDSFINQYYGDIDTLFPSYLSNGVANLHVSLELVDSSKFELSIVQIGSENIILPHIILFGSYQISRHGILLNVDSTHYYPYASNTLGAAIGNSIIRINSNYNSLFILNGTYNRRRIKLKLNLLPISIHLENGFDFNYVQLKRE